MHVVLRPAVAGVDDFILLDAPDCRFGKGDVPGSRDACGDGQARAK
jgi:hypothetical protein